MMLPLTLPNYLGTTLTSAGFAKPHFESEQRLVKL